MALAFETIYGTAPVGGYTRVPFASTTLGSEQPLISTELPRGLSKSSGG